MKFRVINGLVVKDRLGSKDSAGKGERPSAVEDTSVSSVDDVEEFKINLYQTRFLFA